ncbi:MAG TPA: alcohol dehydrogenase catalytic domain-containing protein [Bryobacteraceae bacterium]|nr:alcohol dehydrogenase catalytic domain-containing protein [Bryobacteraceae bacterium]
MQTMLAARYLGPHRIEPVRVPVPEIGDEEALIRVDACGFCGSDIGIVSGVHPRAKEPLTVGHEFCGKVVAIKTRGRGVKTGDFVTMYPLISCDQCFTCRGGNPHVCRSLRLYGFDVDGGMAEYVKVPVPSLIRLPDNMSPYLGAIIEPLAVAVHGVSRAPLQRARTAVVIGAGPIGLLTALAARARGIEHVLISDILLSRIQLAADLGLTARAAGDDVKGLVSEMTSGEGADLVFECAGSAASALEMTSLVRPLGAIVNVSVFKRPVPLEMQAVNFKELTIVGSRVYTREDFAEAVRLAAVLPLRPIVTHSFALWDVQSAYGCFERSEGVCKVVVLPK